MKRLVPLSRRAHDPLEGREWRGYTCGDDLRLDNQHYKFYRYDKRSQTVEISEATTGILWRVQEVYFMYNAESLAPARSRVIFYTVDKDENGKRTITTRRQNARYEYMKTVADRHGTMECEALTKMANYWWPNTQPTIFETGRV